MTVLIYWQVLRPYTRKPVTRFALLLAHDDVFLASVVGIVGACDYTSSRG